MRICLLTLLVLATAADLRAENPWNWFRLKQYAQPGMFYAPTLGPKDIPYHLDGIWRVSLCVKRGFDKGHAWIRYENVHTGEVHTIGRFKSGVPGVIDPDTDEYLYPPIEVSGLHWDVDVKREHEVREGKYLLKTVMIRNPSIYRDEDVYGHGVIRANCVTYARNAWNFYSGDWYDLPTMHTPESLINAMLAEPKPTPKQVAKKPEPRPAPPSPMYSDWRRR